MTHRLACLTALFLFFAVVPVAAQQQSRPAAAGAPPATAQPALRAGAGRVAVINTAAFGDPQGGITRLAAAVQKVAAEFKPQEAELLKLRQQYDATLADIEKTKGLSDPLEVQRKAEQSEALKRELERKGEDAQIAYGKRLQEAVGPLSADISQAMREFAQKRGIGLLLDAGKLQEALMFVGDGVDVTGEFIAEYNKRPAGSASNQVQRPSVAALR